MARFTFDQREAFTRQGFQAVPAPQANATFFIGRNQRGQLAAAAFLGKQTKPVWHHWFPSQAELERKVRETVDAGKRAAAYKAQRAAERKAEGNPWQAGDIAYTSWGYEQTNIDCYECVEVRGMVAIFRKLRCDSEATGSMSEYLTPRRGAFCGEPIRVMAKGGGKISGHFLHRWTEGKRLHATHWA